MEETTEKTEKLAEKNETSSVLSAVTPVFSAVSWFLLPMLLFAACGRGGAAKEEGAARPPVPVVEPAALGSDGLPVGWVDAPYSTRELYFEAEAPGPCPPCPPDARCAPCPPPFHQFSTHPANHPDGVMVFVAFTKPPSGLKVGGFYRLGGRTVPWRPHGDIFITMDHRPREWFPTVRCEALKKDYTELRAKSDNACAVDEDCTILPGGVDDCGRAIDKKTAARLEPIYAMFRDMCGLTLHCGPRLAFAACEGGRCVERSGFPRVGGRPRAVEITPPR